MPAVSSASFDYLASPFLTVPFRFRASLLDEAKRWFESATVICRFVPGGKERAEKVRAAILFASRSPSDYFTFSCRVQISEAYTHLLARYSTR